MKTIYIHIVNAPLFAVLCWRNDVCDINYARWPLLRKTCNCPGISVNKFNSRQEKVRLTENWGNVGGKVCLKNR